MKKIILLSVFALVSTFVLPVYAQNQKDELSIYNHNIKYHGSFETDRVYLYNEADAIWQGFKTLNQFKCYEARTALTTTGAWVGNISDDGQCLGAAEAPEWTSGNFLNFRHEKINK